MLTISLSDTRNSQAARTRSRRPLAPRRRHARPGLEVLDDRIVLSTLMVTNTLDSPDPTPGMLRYAIDQADTDGTHGFGDDIEFASSLNGAHFLLQEGPLTLTSGANVTIWTTNPYTGAEMQIYLNGDADNIFQVDRARAWT